MKKVPDIIKEAAKKLRNNSTITEIILWGYIKGGKLGIKFLRQKPVYVFTENSGLDRYIIPDFYCFENKIIIEIDGSIHNLEEVYELDKYKEELLLNMGFKVIRIKNEEIIDDIKNVIKKINQFVYKR